MDRIFRLLSEIYKTTDRHRNTILGLSVVVVFVSTYLLILPAFTLEKNEAAKQGGISVQGIEAVSEDAGQAQEGKAGSITGDDGNTSANGTNIGAGNSGTDNQDNQTGNGSGDQDSAIDSQKVDGSGSLVYEGDGYDVAIEDANGVLPEGTSLDVREISADRKRDAREYRELSNLAADALRSENIIGEKDEVRFARLYDITLSADGQEVEPAGDECVGVRISYDRQMQKELAVEDADNVHIVHFAEDPETGEIITEIYDSRDVDITVKRDRLAETAFAAESFSVYAVVYTVELQETVITASGETYEITVTYGEDAQIPTGAELKVEEILPGDERYDEYYRRSLEKIGVIDERTIAESISDAITSVIDAAKSSDEKGAEVTNNQADNYVHIFDIEISADGKKIEPEADVDVNIKLLDAPDDIDADLHVVHFGNDGIEIMELAKNEGEKAGETELNFVTDEFSVYSVVNVNNSTKLNGKSFALVSGIAGAVDDYPESWGTDHFVSVVNAHAMEKSAESGGLSSIGVHEWTEGGSSFVGGDVTLWNFENVGNNTYKIYIIENGQKRYVFQGSDPWSNLTSYLGLTPIANPDWATVFSIVPQSDGTVLIKNGNWYLHNNIYSHAGNNAEWSSRNYTMENMNGQTPTGAEYKFKLCQKSDDHDSFAAKKISVQNVDSTKTVIIYRKIVDGDGTERLYAVAHDGSLVRVYDGGDSVYWRETEKKIYWIVDTVTDTSTQRTTTTIHSPASDGAPVVYLSPFKTSNQTTSTASTQPSVSLPGKTDGRYGTSIEVWDQEAYDYAGVHVNENVTKDSNSGKVISVNSVSLEAGTRGEETSDEFLFAEVSSMPPATKKLVDTVDSDKLGIHITVFDYGKYGTGNEYNAGDKLSGMTDIAGSDDYTPHKAHALVTPYLSALEKGVPVSSSNGAMSGLFADEPDSTIDGVKTYAQSGVTNLFLKSYYDENGMFRYRSEDNYAYLGRNGEKSFKVYQQVGSPYPTENVIGHAYYYHGHYMPFNDLDTSKVTSRLVDQYGTDELELGDGRSYDAIYGIDGVPNYYTGMKLEANFTQPRNGKLENGDDMIFKFTGDDDMWVYIDGVLVLDVGGIHEPLSGTINFRTGKVTNPEGSSLEGTSTLYQIMTAAAANANTPQTIKDKINSITWKDVDGDGTPDTFADYGNHSFAAFYMERGAGASNLDLQFNLKTILTDQFTVGKELPDGIDTRYVNQKYRFQATFYDDSDKDTQGNPKEKPLFAGAKKKDGTVVCDKVYYQGHKNPTTGEPVEDPVTVDENGYFTLEAGEVAVFHMKDSSIKYNVKEVDVDQYHLDKITINGTETEHVNVNDDPTKPENNKVEAGEAKVSERSSVLYTNFPKTQSLKITKHILGAAPADTNPTFEFHVYLETTEKDENNNDVHKLVPYSKGSYYLTKEVDGEVHYFQLTGKNDEKGWTNLPVDKGTEPIVCSETGSSGSISRIPAGYTIVIPDLVVGTHFYLVERLDNLPDGCSYVREDIVDGTFDTKTLDPVVIDKRLASDEREVSDTYDEDTIGKIKYGVDAESHVYNRYGIVATKEWQDADGNSVQLNAQGESAENPLWTANVTFKLRVKKVEEITDSETGEKSQKITYRDVYAQDATPNKPSYFAQNNLDWSDTITLESAVGEANWTHLDNLDDGESYVIIESDVAGATDVVKDKSGAIKSFKLNGKVYKTANSELGEEGGKIINKEQKLTDIEVEKEWDMPTGLSHGDSTMVLYQVIGKKSEDLKPGEVDPAKPNADNIRVRVKVNKKDADGEEATVSDTAYITVSYTGKNKDGNDISGSYTLNNTNGWSHTFELPRYSKVDFTYTTDSNKIISVTPQETKDVDSSRTIEVNAVVVASRPRTYTFTVPENLRGDLPSNGKIKVTVPAAFVADPQYADNTNNWTVSFTVPDEANIDYTVESGNGFFSSVTTTGKASGQQSTSDETIQMTPSIAPTETTGIPVSVNWTGESVPAGTNIVVTFAPDKRGVEDQTVTLNGSEGTPWNTTIRLRRIDDSGELISWTATAAKGNGVSGSVSVNSVPTTGATIRDTKGSGVLVDATVTKDTMTVPIIIDWGTETPDAGTNVRVTFSSDKAGVTADPIDLTSANAGSGSDVHKWIATANLPRIDSTGNLITWTASAAVTASSGATASVPATQLNDIKDSNGDGIADKKAEWTGTVARGMNLKLLVPASAHANFDHFFVGYPSDIDSTWTDITSTKSFETGYKGNGTKYEKEYFNLDVKSASGNDNYYAIKLFDVPYKITTNATEAGTGIHNGNKVLWIKAKSGDVTIKFEQSTNDDWQISTGQNMNSAAPNNSTFSLSKLKAFFSKAPRKAPSTYNTFEDKSIVKTESRPAFTMIQYKDLPAGATVVNQDGKEHSGTQTIKATSTDNKSFKWEDLPTEDANGNPIYYYVVEKDAAAVADTMTVKYQYEYNADGTIKKVKIVNKTTGEPTTITLKKEWLDKDGQPTDKFKDSDEKLKFDIYQIAKTAPTNESEDKVNLKLMVRARDGSKYLNDANGSLTSPSEKNVEIPKGSEVTITFTKEEETTAEFGSSYDYYVGSSYEAANLTRTSEDNSASYKFTASDDSLVRIYNDNMYWRDFAADVKIGDVQIVETKFSEVELTKSDNWAKTIPVNTTIVNGDKTTTYTYYAVETYNGVEGTVFRKDLMTDVANGVLTATNQETHTQQQTKKADPEIRKYVEKLEKDDDYDLTLTAKVAPLVPGKKLDILFVIDTTGSMTYAMDGTHNYSNERWNAITSAVGNITTYLSDQDVRYAAVRFSDSATQWGAASTLQTWTDKGSDISTALNGQSLSGGTNYESAFYELNHNNSNLLGAARPEAEKLIFFISDGEPNVYYDEYGNGIDVGGVTGGYVWSSEINDYISPIALNEAKSELAKLKGYDGFYAIGVGSQVGMSTLNELTKASGAEMQGSYICHEAGAVYDSLVSALSTVAPVRKVTITDTLSDYAQPSGGDNAKLQINVITTTRDANDATKVVTYHAVKTLKAIAEETDPENKNVTLSLPATDKNVASTLRATYDATTKQIKLEFPEDYILEDGWDYQVTMTIEPTLKAYNEYSNSGYAKDGDNQVIKGDPNTDVVPGTEVTSSNKEGFRSNTEAKITYEGGEKKYPDPVIQTLKTKIQLLKIDGSTASNDTPTTLAGAKFNLYRVARANSSNSTKEAETSATITKLKVSENSEINVVKIGDTLTTSDNGTITFDKLIPGKYYLQEAEAPQNYTGISGLYCFDITVSDYDKNKASDWKLVITPVEHASDTGISTPTWDSTNNQYKLTVPNTMNGGYELPSTGGPGTTLLYLIGSILVLGAGFLLWRRRRLI